MQNIWFLSSLVLSKWDKMREKYTNWDNLVCVSLYIFRVCFSILEWWKCQMNFFDTFLKKYTHKDNLSCLKINMKLFLQNSVHEFWCIIFFIPQTHNLIYRHWNLLLWYCLTLQSISIGLHGSLFLAPSDPLKLFW